jgi:hypothetical protein
MGAAVRALSPFGGYGSQGVEHLHQGREGFLQGLEAPDVSGDDMFDTVGKLTQRHLRLGTELDHKGAPGARVGWCSLTVPYESFSGIYRH